MNHSPFNELNSWINSLLKKRNGNVNDSLFLVNGEWNFQFIFHSFWKKKWIFEWKGRGENSIYSLRTLLSKVTIFQSFLSHFYKLFSNSFFSTLNIHRWTRVCWIPWCISWDAFTRLANNTLRGDATNTTNANCLLAGLTYTYSLQPATSPKEMRQNHCKITSEKWIENELKMNWFIVKWMVNWIDSPFFKMNGELNWFTVFWNEWWIESFTKKWWMDTGLIWSHVLTWLHDVPGILPPSQTSKNAKLYAHETKT